MRVIHSSYFPKISTTNQTCVKANSARWHKGMCHLQTHVRLHGVPAKLSAALRTNQTKHTLDPEVDSREKSHETMVFNPIGYQVS